MLRLVNESGKATTGFERTHGFSIIYVCMTIRSVT